MLRNEGVFEYFIYYLKENSDHNLIEAIENALEISYK